MHFVYLCFILQKYESESEEETADTSASTPQPTASFSPTEIKMDIDTRKVQDEPDDSSSEIKSETSTNITICHDDGSAESTDAISEPKPSDEIASTDTVESAPEPMTK